MNTSTNSISSLVSLVDIDELNNSVISGVRVASNENQKPGKRIIIHILRYLLILSKTIPIKKTI